jgi:hypothetical protein
MIILLSPLFFLFAFPSPVRSQAVDSVRAGACYFPFDRADLLRDYASNRAMLSALDSLLHLPAVVSGIDTIQITAGCSPAGSEDYNKRLAARRAMAMRTYLRRKHLAVAEKYPLQIFPVGIDRAGYKALKNSGRRLTEKQIWNLLQYATVRLKMQDGSYIHPGAESQVRAIVKAGGELPAIPEGQPVITGETPIKEAEEAATGEGKAADPPFLQDGSAGTGAAEAVPAAADTVFIPRAAYGNSRLLRYAVKTNLLYDAALLPNLGLEIAFGDGWSASLYGAFSKWDTHAPRYWSHQINYAGADIRYWPDNKKCPRPLSGWFTGLSFTGGVYDLRLFTDDLDDYGYLSRWSWTAGLTGGYSMALSRKLNLEFSLNAGYFTGEYHAYNRSRCMDCFPERKTGTRHYWGPTGAGVSLVYLFNGGD